MNKNYFYAVPRMGVRFYFACFSALFNLQAKASSNETESSFPGVVNIPDAPKMLADIPDFEQKLSAVQNAYWAFKTGSPQADEGQKVTALYLDSQPQQVALDPSKALISCSEFKTLQDQAQKEWLQVILMTQTIRDKTALLRNENDALRINSGIAELGALVDETKVLADGVARTFPTSLFSTPDRTIKYKWEVLPSNVFASWKMSWHIVNDDFKPHLLALPGFTWAGQVAVTEIAQITRAPYIEKNSLVFEREASPASACAGPEAVWIEGFITVSYKLAGESTLGCAGGDLCVTAPADPKIYEDVVKVVLHGERKPTISRPDLPLKSILCSKPSPNDFDAFRAEPIQCPN